MYKQKICGSYVAYQHNLCYKKGYKPIILGLVGFTTNRQAGRLADKI